uniref:Evasin n=1 Tax=Amblyomma tuberculatum TaxID=48802 RepID=A0A6M2E3B4_9ACAR
MMLLWIFALAIGTVASTEKGNVGVVQGCGESPNPSVKPGENNYGLVTDVNSCERKVLLLGKFELAASCIIRCPLKNYSYPLPDGTRCLKLQKKNFLQERKDTSPRICRPGYCENGVCKPIRYRRKQVRCTVPKNRRDLRE